MVKLRKLPTRASKSKESTTTLTHNHSNFIMEQYLQSHYGGLHANQTETDVILILNDGFVFSHAVILQEVSPFFGKMLDSQGPFIHGMRKILMPDFTKPIISKVLQLIYSSQVQLNSEEELHEVQNVLKFLEIRTNETLCVIQSSANNNAKNSNDSISMKQGTITSHLQNPSSGSSSNANCTTNSSDQLNNEETVSSSKSSSKNSLEPQPEPRTRKGKKQLAASSTPISTSTTNNDDNNNSKSASLLLNKKDESSSESDDGDDNNANNNSANAGVVKGKQKRKLKKIPTNTNNNKNKKQKTVNPTPNSNNNNVSKPSNSKVMETLNGNNHAESILDKEEDNSYDEDAIEFKNTDWLLNKASKCQKCKKVYESPALASTCLSRHRLLRCYFCFRLFRNTEQLFQHFSRAHKNTRENYLQCPFCDQSVPFKSVSCHCISLHMLNQKEPMHKKTFTCSVPSSSLSSQPSEPIAGPSRIITGVKNDVTDDEKDLSNPNPNYVDSDSD